VEFHQLNKIRLSKNLDKRKTKNGVTIHNNKEKGPLDDSALFLAEDYPLEE
jgi:hypothetical protein